ncbi:MAG: PqiC family protein [Candidatus Aceula meridiana]|nr:PqiC family protein [Candidatus Aceula meridiana]
MNKIWIRSFIMIIGVGFALVLGGCISVSNSPTPRFYVLQAGYENQVNKKIGATSDFVIGIGPVKIPEYQDRAKIVTRGKDQMLKFSEFDRWGESLSLGVTRLIRENLTAMFPRAKFILYPWNSAIEAKYQVVVEVIQLDSDLQKELFLIAQWQVIDVQNTKIMIIKRSEFRQPIIPQNYSGLAKTLSTVCASLSREIAESIVTIEKKENDSASQEASQE